MYNLTSEKTYTNSYPQLKLYYKELPFEYFYSEPTQYTENISIK